MSLCLTCIIFGQHPEPGGFRGRKLKLLGNDGRHGLLSVISYARYG